MLERARGFAAVYRPSGQAAAGVGAGTNIGTQQNYNFQQVNVDDRGIDFITKTVGYQQALMGFLPVGVSGSGAVPGSEEQPGASERSSSPAGGHASGSPATPIHGIHG
jgi:hypothetical protein